MFQARVVDGGDTMLGALLYKQPSAGVMNYLSNNINNVINTTANLSDKFVNMVKSQYNKFYHNDVIQASKQLLNTAGYSFDQWTIYNVPYDSFNTVNLCMQQYIMADPVMDKLNRRNQCNGFQGTYIDPEPETFGEEKLLYQRVMDGVVQFDKDERAYVAHYSNTDEVELDIYDIINVLDTWNTSQRLLAEGKDPSDPTA